MIHQVLNYWVDNDASPSKDDIVAAIEEAKKHQCHVCLHWKGPGYRYYGDTYSRTVNPDSNAQEVYNGLPKVYGI